MKKIQAPDKSKKMQQSEEQFQVMFDIAPIGMAQADPQTGRFLRMNRKVCEITGYTANELLEMTISDITHPEDRDRSWTEYQRVVRGEAPDFKLEKRYIRKDGMIVWVNINTTVIRDVDGRPLRTVGIIEDISSRKEAEEKLKQSEKNFRKVFHTNQDSISVTRLSDGTYHLVNEGFTRYTGYDAADVIGRTSFDVNIWEDLADRDRLLEGLARDGIVASLDANFRRKDGSIVSGIMSASVIDLDGIPHLFTVTRDITDRKQAEEKLRESEEKYRILVENAIESVYIVQDGRFKFANPATEKLFGCSREELALRPFTDFVHPDDRALVVDRYVKRIKGEAVPSRYAFRLIRSTGETRWAELNVVLVEWERQPATLNFLTDITARRQAEAELARAHEFIENIEDACYEMDLSGNLIFCNEAFLKSAGYAYGEYMALSRWDRHPTREEAKRVFKIYEAVHQSGIPVKSVEYLNLKKNGIVNSVEVSISLIRDESGKPTGFRGIGRDISHRKQQETEKQQLEERLQRAEKMEALGTLAGGVAHDLNNVLGVIVGFSEMLIVKIGEDSPHAPLVKYIMEGGQRAAAIVQDLLTLARRGVPTKKVVNLNTIVADFLKTPEVDKIILNKPNIRIQTDFAPDLLNVMGSPVHLSKTVMNLVSNAADAMPDGGVLTITTTNRYLDRPVRGYDDVRSGDYVVLSIADTGEGISATDLNRIFEPFYTKKVMGRSGTGLGLAVVWGTVKDHEGYIDVQSGVGKGSTFSLYFPVTREVVTAEQISVRLAEYLGNGESILVVDDIPEQRELATWMLTSLNYRVTVASSGEEAIEYLKGHNADLLVLDMIMDPGMDGLDTYRESLKISPQQKAIIVSGFAETERVQEAQELGASAYIRKPYVIEKLGLAVKAALSGSC